MANPASRWLDARHAAHLACREQPEAAALGELGPGRWEIAPGPAERGTR